MINSYKINPQIRNNSVKQAYMSFPPNTQIKGTLISKSDKQIRILTKENETLELTLKKDIEIRKGESIAISKKDISDIKVMTEDNLTDEQLKNQQITDKLQDMNIKPSEPMIKAYKDLEKFEIPVTAENLEKYLAVSISLENLRGSLTPQNAASLTETGYDIDDMPVFEISRLLSENSFADIASDPSKKLMSDKQAAEISKELYGMDMGKDINDIIKSLDARGIVPTRELTDALSMLYSKLYNIKDADESVIVRALESENISIDLLYSIKNSIRMSPITNAAPKNPYQLPQQKPMTDAQIEKVEAQIRDLVKELGFDDSMLRIAKALMKADMDINTQNIKSASDIQQALQMLQADLDKQTAAAIMAKNQDILSMDILKLAKMVSDIKNEESNMDVSATKEQLELAGKISDAIKQLSVKDMPLKDTPLKYLLPYSENKSRSVTELFGSSYTAFSDHNELSAIRASYILKNIEDISLVDIDISKRTLSLSSIAKQAGIIPQSFDDRTPNEGSGRFMESRVLEQADLRQAEQGVSSYKKEQITALYNQLRENVRMSHLISMSKSGIDPVTSDISRLNQYIKAYEDKYSRYDFSKTSDFDIRRSSVDIVRSGSDMNLKTASKALDIASSKTYFTDIIDKLADASKTRGFSELEDLTKQITQQLKMPKESKEDYRQQAMQLHMLLKESEEVVKGSKREDREIFDRYLKQMSDSIKMSHRIKETDSMVQIPFYMNDGGSNANVYAKTKKGKKGQIDPEDMSILMDITTKKLGKLGFYIEVDKKNISLKISGEKNAVSAMRHDAQSLNNLLETAGYSLRSLKLSDSVEQTQIEFTEDTAPEFKTSLDVKV